MKRFIKVEGYENGNRDLIREYYIIPDYIDQVSGISGANKGCRIVLKPEYRGLNAENRNRFDAPVNIQSIECIDSVKDVMDKLNK